MFQQYYFSSWVRFVKICDISIANSDRKCQAQCSPRAMPACCQAWLAVNLLVVKYHPGTQIARVSRHDRAYRLQGFAMTR
jgi:hypothetical protein